MYTTTTTNTSMTTTTFTTSTTATTTVSEVHNQWGNEKRECMCLSLSLRFSLGTIKDDEHEGSPSLHIAFLLRKTGDFTSVKLNRER